MDTPDSVTLIKMRPRRFIMAFLSAFIPFAVVVTLGFVAYHWVSSTNTLESLRLEERILIDRSEQAVVRDFPGIASDLLILSEDPTLIDHVSSPSAPVLDHLQREFMVFSRNKRIYDQIRYIDADGVERVRVDMNRGTPVAVEGDQLQDKSGRYYVAQTLALRRGGMFISPLDLNRENGELEKPYKPMLRFAAPVFDAHGDKVGMVILNYSARYSLETFTQATKTTHGRAMMLNADGFWLAADDPTLEWGFMRGKPELTFAISQPAAWAAMDQSQGQRVTADGLITWSTIYPGRAVGVANHGAADVQQHWRLVSFIPKQDLARLTQGETTLLTALFALCLLLIATLSASFAMARLRHAHADEARRLSARVTEVTRDGVVILDEQETISSVNHGFSALTGYLPNEVQGRDYAQLRAEEHTDAGYWQRVRSTVERAGQWEGEVWHRRKNGCAFPSHLSISAIRSDRGRLAHLVAIFSDITERKAYERNLKQLAHHDALTGLPNRHLLDDRMEVAVATARRHGVGMALMFVDLDGFKPINDSLGHDVGDSVLQTVSQRLLEAVRESDTVARVGGDEFVLLLQDVAQREDAEAVAEKVLELVPQSITITGQSCRVGVSIGLALFPEHGETVDALMRRADSAMYSAKRAGKGRYHVYDEHNDTLEPIQPAHTRASQPPAQGDSATDADTGQAPG